MEEQRILHIDATPDESYPIRILQAYRRLGDSVWSLSTNTTPSADESHPLIKAMNDAQKKRNVLLERAIKILENDKIRRAAENHLVIAEIEHAKS